MPQITLFQGMDTNIKWPKGVKRFESYDYFKFYSTEVPWNCAHGVQLSFSLRIRPATLRCTNTGHLTGYPTFQALSAAYRTFHKRSTRHCTNYRIQNSLIYKLPHILQAGTNGRAAALTRKLLPVGAKGGPAEKRYTSYYCPGADQRCVSCRHCANGAAVHDAKGRDRLMKAKERRNR